MLSFLRAAAPPRTNNASNNPIIYESGLSSMEFHAPESVFIMTHRLPPTSAMPDPSIFQPPLHYHIHQSEYFNIRSGTGNFYKGQDPKPFITLSSAEGAPKRLPFLGGRYHRFENASETEELVLDVNLTPEDYENEQKFFRNFFWVLG